MCVWSLSRLEKSLEKYCGVYSLTAVPAVFWYYCGYLYTRGQAGAVNQCDWCGNMTLMCCASMRSQMTSDTYDWGKTGVFYRRVQRIDYGIGGGGWHGGGAGTGEAGTVVAGTGVMAGLAIW